VHNQASHAISQLAPWVKIGVGVIEWKLHLRKAQLSSNNISTTKVLEDERQPQSARKVVAVGFLLSCFWMRDT